MIQRIQTIYLILVLVLSGIAPMFFDVLNEAGTAYIPLYTDIVYVSLFAIGAMLALISIFLYKNRKNQFVINRLNMIFQLILLGVFVYRSLTLPGEANASEKGIWMLFPIISIVFLVLANRAIKKDEDLVKSVDRLR